MAKYARMLLTQVCPFGSREVEARRLTPRFAAWRPSRRVGWTVTHIPTGYRAGSFSFRTLAQARSYVKALEQRFGATAWDFTDPQTVLNGAGRVARAIAKRVQARAL